MDLVILLQIFRCDGRSSVFFSFDFSRFIEIMILISTCIIKLVQYFKFWLIWKVFKVANRHTFFFGFHLNSIKCYAKKVMLENKKIKNTKNQCKSIDAIISQNCGRIMLYNIVQEREIPFENNLLFMMNGRTCLPKILRMSFNRLKWWPFKIDANDAVVRLPM